MGYKLYPHQKEMVKSVSKKLKKRSHIILGSATGSGKSVMILDMVEKFNAQGKKVLLLAPRRELIKQLTETLKSLKPLTLLGNVVTGRLDSKIIISSRQTTSNRIKQGHKAFTDIDVVIIDEVHMGASFPPKSGSQFELLYNKFWDSALWIGFSATPINAKGYRLKGWDETVYKYQTGKLIDMGFLADYDYYAPETIDLSTLKVANGEYTKESIDEVVFNSTAITSVKKVWKKHHTKRKIVIFAASIDHATLLHKELVGSHILHSKLPESKRRIILDNFKKDKHGTLINIDILTTGFNDETVDCLIFARPIKSIPLAIQCFGRALRKYGDKKALILDLCNVYESCGLPRDVRDFNRVEKPTEKQIRKENDDVQATRCPHCKDVFPSIDVIKKEKVKKKYTLTTKICPVCSKVIDEVRVDLTVVDKLVKIEEVEVKELSRSYRKGAMRHLMNKFDSHYKDNYLNYMWSAFETTKSWYLFDKIVAENVNNEQAMWNKLKYRKKQLEK